MSITPQPRRASMLRNASDLLTGARRLDEEIAVIGAAWPVWAPPVSSRKHDVVV